MSKAGIAGNNPTVCLADEGITLANKSTYRWRVQYRDQVSPTATPGGAILSIFTSDSRLSYDFYMSQDASFQQVLYTKTNIMVGQSKATVSLANQYMGIEDGGQSYLWKVKVTDPAGNSSWNEPTSATPSLPYFTFSISDTFPPAVSNITYPLNGDRLINDKPTFMWTATNDSNGPVEYALQFSTYGDFAELASFNGQTEFASGNSGQDTYWTVDPNLLTLDRNKRYYVRVKATDQPVYDGNGDLVKAALSSYGPAISFRVVGEVAYQVSIRDTGGPVLTTSSSVALERTLSAQEGEMLVADGREYTWSVTATDPAGNQRVSAEQIFKLEDVYPPMVPSTLYPTAMDVINDTTPTLMFTKTFDISAAGDQPDAVQYQIMAKVNCTADIPLCQTYQTTWKTAADFSSSDDFDTGTVLGFQLADLMPVQAGRTYLWQVTVKDQAGFSVATPMQRFSVKQKALATASA